MPYHSPYPEKSIIFPLLEFLIAYKATPDGMGLKHEVKIPLGDFEELPGGLRIMVENDLNKLKKDLVFLSKEPWNGGTLLTITTPEVLDRLSQGFAAGEPIGLVYDCMELAHYYKELMERDQLRARGFSVQNLLARLGVSVDTENQTVRPRIPLHIRWQDVIFEFMNELVIQIRSSQGMFPSFNISAAEMDMVVKKNGQANKQWQLLQKLARQRGIIDIDSHSQTGRAESQQKSLLARKLKQHLGLTEDPFENAHQEGAYKIKMRLIVQGEITGQNRSESARPTAEQREAMIHSEVQEMFKGLPRAGREDFEPDEG